MTVLLQISDPHFGTERPAVVDALLRLVHEQAPNLVVVSGDITQRARSSQFLAARAFMDRLAVPVKLVIPGNHDIPLFNLASRLLDPYANFRSAFGNDLEPIFESKQMLVITVNTTRYYRHTDGEVSAQQIERVAQRLKQASTHQLRVVVTHQPVAVTREQDETNLLHGGDTAVRSWARAGADMILGGHIHLPFIVPLHERFTDLPRNLWAVQAGTAISHRIRHDAGNSINLIRYDGAGLTGRNATVERWDYLDSAQDFRAVEITRLACTANNNAA